MYASTRLLTLLRRILVVGGSSSIRGLLLTVTVTKVFTLEVAHLLPKVPAQHKCARMHGHSLRVGVHVSGGVDPDTGMVIDFATVSAAWAVVHAALDHRLLNDVHGR